jgi:hypothetical protein
MQVGTWQLLKLYNLSGVSPALGSSDGGIPFLLRGRALQTRSKTRHLIHRIVCPLFWPLAAIGASK